MTTVDTRAALDAALATWREAWRETDRPDDVDPSEITEATAEAVAARTVEACESLAAAFDAYATDQQANALAAEGKREQVQMIADLVATTRLSFDEVTQAVGLLDQIEREAAGKRTYLKALDQLGRQLGEAVGRDPANFRTEYGTDDLLADVRQQRAERDEARREADKLRSALRLANASTERRGQRLTALRAGVQRIAGHAHDDWQALGDGSEIGLIHRGYREVLYGLLEGTEPTAPPADARALAALRALRAALTALADEAEAVPDQMPLHALIRRVRGLANPMVMPGCTCPWNNGYHGPGVVKGHHIACPTLRGTHTPDDQCGKDGHTDATALPRCPDCGAQHDMRPCQVEAADCDCCRAIIAATTNR